MPFRLTRQFINLMLPLKESGTLQSVMVHTLRALRSNHELLVNTMDVFIKEPSIDWQVCPAFSVLSFICQLSHPGQQPEIFSNRGIILKDALESNFTIEFVALTLANPEPSI